MNTPTLHVFHTLAKNSLTALARLFGSHIKIHKYHPSRFQTIGLNCTLICADHSCIFNSCLIAVAFASMLIPPVFDELQFTP